MNEIERCPWCGTDPLYTRYHDEEWGVPVRDDRKQFEFLVLESAQAGLSWITILKRRRGYAEAYRGFDPEKVARFDEKDVERLMNDPGIIRNRKKIESSVNNAQRFLEVQEEFGSFCRYIWDFVDGAPLVNHWKTMEEVPAETELSRAVAKDLKARGFRFLGPVIVYSHMQATGLIDDHLTGCFRRTRRS